MFSDCHRYMHGHVRCRPNACVIALLCLTGCTTVVRQPITLDESAFNTRLETIIVMPVLDARAEKSVSFAPSESKRVLKRVINKLVALGYDVQTANTWNVPPDVTPQQFLDMSTAELCRYLPANSRVALIVSVDGLRSTYSVLLNSFSISATVSLVDVSSRKEIWKDAAIGQYGGGGIVGASLTQIGKRAFAYDALAKTAFESFPKRLGGETGRPMRTEER